MYKVPYKCKRDVRNAVVFNGEAGERTFDSRRVIARVENIKDDYRAPWDDGRDVHVTGVDHIKDDWKPRQNADRNVP